MQGISALVRMQRGLRNAPATSDRTSPTMSMKHHIRDVLNERYQETGLSQADFVSRARTKGFRLSTSDISRLSNHRTPPKYTETWASDAMVEKYAAALDTTASELWAEALSRLVDDEELRAGDEITPRLRKVVLRHLRATR